MKFLRRIYQFFTAQHNDGASAAPYPLCPDEWETIQQWEELRAQAPPLQSLGLKAQGSAWVIDQE